MVRDGTNTVADLMSKGRKMLGMWKKVLSGVTTYSCICKFYIKFLSPCSVWAPISCSLEKNEHGLGLRDITVCPCINVFLDTYKKLARS